jgi:5-methyltetrahydropteroyltriglutamate--homocysteine methyltransferase
MGNVGTFGAGDRERTPRRPARAEPVGSLLRPEPIKRMFERAFAQHESHVARLLDERERVELAELDALADAAVWAAIARQIEAGMDVVTDGELRRAHFVNSLFDAVEGIADNPEKDYFAGDDEVGPPPDPVAAERLRIIDNPMAREAAFLRSCTAFPSKVAIPAISNYYMVQYRTGPYASRDDYVAHMGELTASLVLGAIETGADYIQFDFPLYPALADPDKRAELEQGLGLDAATILERAIAADNAVLEGLPASVTTAMHMCRGNYRSRWWARGSLDTVAERIFNELRFDRFLVEWEDTEREGDYAALRFVPTPGPVVVMGVVSSKVGELESDAEILRRMDQAASYLDTAQLAVSPQCGFASVWHGNDITEDMQWRKLDLVGRVADTIWGRADG